MRFGDDILPCRYNVNANIARHAGRLVVVLLFVIKAFLEESENGL